MLDKNTVICISVSGRPSNFGTTLHNAGYRELGLNFAYKGFAISDIAGAIAGVRALGIRGCSVSMPYKESVIPYLDDLDDSARTIGAVNTVVNDSGKLIGYNTDAMGACVAIRELNISCEQKVLLLGAGGAAKAILYALGSLGFNKIVVANRTFNRSEELKGILTIDCVNWEDRENVQSDLLINATSIGMDPQPDIMPVSREYLNGCTSVMDVVVTPMESKLINVAKRLGLAVAPGYRMSLHQAAGQFKKYTQKEAPLAVMESALLNLFKMR